MNTKTNYYNEIKDTLVKNEIYKKVKDYSKNRNDLMSYYKVGKLLIEAQGGEDRAKYGDNLIKEYSEKLTEELGKGYDISNLKRFRAFFLLIQKGGTLCHQLTWSHYRYILPINDIEIINYYIKISIAENLSVRQLRQRIKDKEYERLPHKQELDKPKVNTFVKNPIIIYRKDNKKELSVKILHQYILEDLEHFLHELGQGFTFVGSEYKIKIKDTYHYIDFLLFNIKYNCYVVVELKVNEFDERDVGQVLKYINYIDKHMKEENHNRTFGIIVCKKGNDYIYEYVRQENIDITNYKICSN